MDNNEQQKNTFDIKIKALTRMNGLAIHIQILSLYPYILFQVE